MSALIIKHNGIKKSKGIDYIIPQELVTAIFNQLGGRNGNEIKLILTLLGCKGDGKLTENFSIPLKTACNLTGMTKSRYYTARNHLKEMGWIDITDDGILIVNVNKILVNTGF